MFLKSQPCVDADNLSAKPNCHLLPEWEAYHTGRSVFPKTAAFYVESDLLIAKTYISEQSKSCKVLLVWKCAIMHP